MARFDFSLAQAPVAPVGPAAAVEDNTMAEVVNAAGGMLIEARKGKLMADLEGPRGFVEGVDPTEHGSLVSGEELTSEGKSLLEKNRLNLARIKAGVEQGKISPAEARVLSRAAVKKFTNIAPGLTQEFQQSAASFFGESPSMFAPGAGLLQDPSGANDTTKWWQDAVVKAGHPPEAWNDPRAREDAMVVVRNDAELAAIKAQQERTKIVMPEHITKQVHAVMLPMLNQLRNVQNPQDAVPLIRGTIQQWAGFKAATLAANPTLSSEMSGYFTAMDEQVAQLREIASGKIDQETFSTAVGIIESLSVLNTHAGNQSATEALLALGHITNKIPGAQVNLTQLRAANIVAELIDATTASGQSSVPYSSLSPMSKQTSRKALVDFVDMFNNDKFTSGSPSAMSDQFYQPIVGKIREMVVDMVGSPRLKSAELVTTYGALAKLDLKKLEELHPESHRELRGLVGETAPILFNTMEEAFKRVPNAHFFNWNPSADGLVTVAEGLSPTQQAIAVEQAKTFNEGSGFKHVLQAYFNFSGEPDKQKALALLREQATRVRDIRSASPGKTIGE